MKKQRYELLQALIKEGRWVIDATTGHVTGRMGSTGHIDTFGYRRMALIHEGKEYHFANHEIIAVEQGWDIVDKELTFIDGDRTNITLDNIMVREKGEAARAALLKMGGASRNKLTNEKAREIKIDLKQGMSQKAAAQKHKANIRAVMRIAEGKTFAHVDVEGVK